MSRPKIVFFHQQTTGIKTNRCDIIQLSAVCGEKVFNAFTLPLEEITSEVNDITGFSVSDGALFHHGKWVATIPLKELLTSFIAFLRSFRCPLVLAAHNAKSFDARVLTRVLAQLYLLQEFKEVVFGFLDTRPLIRDVCPGLASYAQKNLVRNILGKSYDAYDALEDAKILQELVNALNPSYSDISEFIFSSF